MFWNDLDRVVEREVTCIGYMCWYLNGRVGDMMRLSIIDAFGVPAIA